MSEREKSTQKSESQSRGCEMKRNWTLIKLLLRHVERHVTAETLRDIGIPYPERLNEFSNVDQIAYHIDLCEEAGFIIIANKDIRHIRRLTWEGHNRLDELSKPESP